MTAMKSVRPNAGQARRLEYIAPEGFPSIAPGMPLEPLIEAASRDAGAPLQDGDVVVLAQKIVSKSERRYVNLRDIAPSEEAIALARRCGKDARLVECILGESSVVVRGKPGLLIVRHKLGFTLANAGIDQSNLHREENGEWVLLLPQDPDASAKRICLALQASTGKRLGVAIIDSWGRAWRVGTCGICIGAFNVATVSDMRGQKDLFGRTLDATVVGIGDELAAGASLLMGQGAEGTPMVIARGDGLVGDGTANPLIRPLSEDVFQ